MQFLKSPLNYTGNKFRIIEQLTDIFPKEMNNFVDLFCGSATVGFNVNANKVFLVDNNKYVIALLKFLVSSDFDALILKIEKKIAKYNLSYSYKFGFEKYFLISNIKDNNGLKFYNFKPFNKLKKDFNALENKCTDEALLLLYLLIIYGFNNEIRFNKNNEFNIPVGKTDFNKNNYFKLKNFIERGKNINYEFIWSNFNDIDLNNIILNADLIYLDPPYLITTAAYNENGGWNEMKEKELLDFLQKCINLRKNFVLSNILRKSGRTNKQLERWIEKNKKYIKVKPIKLHYKSSSYNKTIRDGSEEEIVVVSNFNEVSNSK